MALKISDIRDAKVRALLQKAAASKNPTDYREAKKIQLTPAMFKAVAQEPTTGKRIRQSNKPLLNKWEQEWHDHLQATLPTGTRIYKQAWRVRLGNNAWYKCDLVALVNGRWTAYEIKGGKKMKGVSKGILALKVAAAAMPEVLWILVWKDGGKWQQQTVLP